MDPSSSDPRTRFVFRAAVALLCVVVVAIYAGSLSGEYLWDDTPLVRDNPLLTGLRGLRGLFTTDLWGGATGRSTQLYHPIPMATLWLQALATGRSLVAFRVGNLALHGACVALLYAWLRRERVSPRSTLLAASAFALHPSSVEVVLWVTGRHDSVGALLVLLVLLAWMRPYSLLAAAAAAAAFASKEGFIVAPALLALTAHRAYPAASLAKRASRLALPVAAVAAIFAVRDALGISSTSAQMSAPPTELLRHYASIVAHYFTQIVSFNAGPTIRSYDSLAPWQAGVVLATIAAVLVGLEALRRRGLARAEPMLFGVAWFLLGLAPHVASLPLLGLYANRYAYFPAMGLVLVLGQVVAAVEERWPSEARRLIPLAATLLVIPALRCAANASDWRDDVSLYGADIARNPNDGRALYHYGYAVYRRGGCPRALPWFGRAARFAPEYPRPWHNLAGCLLNVGRPADALTPARRALDLDLDQNNPDNHFNLGLALASTGHPDEAAASLRRALALDPRHAAARRLLASLDHSSRR